LIKEVHMARNAKGSISVIILILLLAAAIGAAAVVFLDLQKEKEHSAKLENDIAQLEVKKRSAEQEARRLGEQISEFKRQIEEQKAKIADFDVKITSMNEELFAEKREKEDALLEVERFREELAELIAAKSNLESELNTGREEIVQLKDKLALLESEKEREKVKQKHPSREGEKTAEVQLEKIVVVKEKKEEGAVAEKASPAQPALEGRVVAVNEEYNFIVISLGRKDNLGVDDTIDVLRQDKKISEAKIEEIRDAMSVATPVLRDAIRNIKVGDRAILK
jgi:chromosome segregation ATPase